MWAMENGYFITKSALHLHKKRNGIVYRSLLCIALLADLGRPGIRA
jgi:hypothetical protein